MDLPAGLPPNAYAHIPQLIIEQQALWPQLHHPSVLAATIEQETCISLKHVKCWSSRAELKTARENGFGFGQTTVAYNADGSERFNTWRDLRTKHNAQLQGWTWANRYDARYQLRALVLKKKADHARVKPVAGSELDAAAFAANAYNAGPGMLARSRADCARRSGCDPTRWFGHVEYAAGPSTKRVAGYGQSFYDISRSYVHNVIVVRRVRYAFLDPIKERSNDSDVD